LSRRCGLLSKLTARQASRLGQWQITCPARQPDILKRLAVEQKAVELTWQHYTQLGYALTPVEKDNVGWDLEAVVGCIHLKLEVKGLLCLDIAIELPSTSIVTYILNCIGPVIVFALSPGLYLTLTCASSHTLLRKASG
jgi:hypothetical protein